jgi:hypothetical protein
VSSSSSYLSSSEPRSSVLATLSSSPSMPQHPLLVPKPEVKEEPRSPPRTNCQHRHPRAVEPSPPCGHMRFCRMKLEQHEKKKAITPRGHAGRLRMPNGHAPHQRRPENELELLAALGASMNDHNAMAAPLIIDIASQRRRLAILSI